MSSPGEEQQVGDSREARNVGVYTHSLLPGPAASSDGPPGTVFTVEKSRQMAECSAGPASSRRGLQLRWFCVSWRGGFVCLVFSSCDYFSLQFVQKGGYMQAATPCQMRSSYGSERHLFNLLELHILGEMPLETNWTVSYP